MFVLLLLPYCMMLLITPVYLLLDKTVFLKVFGCGCVPSAQTNMLNIDFNANDLRFLVYGIITILMVVWGFVFSRNFRNKGIRWVYIVSIFAVNLIFADQICRLFLYN